MGSESRPRIDKRNVSVIAAVLVIFASAVFSHIGSLKNGWVMDDFAVIAGNEYVREWDSFKMLLTKDYFLMPFPVKTGARPLTLASLALDTALHKGKEYGYHLTNILLHGLNSVLVFFVALFVLGKRGVLNSLETRNPRLETVAYAFFAALVFALHPITAEPVNVASFRGDLLSGFFYIGAVVFMAAAAELRMPALYAGSLGFFALGMLTKETAVTFPLAALVYFSVFKREELKTGFLRVFIIAGFIIALSIFLFWSERVSYRLHNVLYLAIVGGVSPLSGAWAYFNTVFASFWHNALALVLPAGLSVEYQFAISRDAPVPGAISGFMVFAALIFVLFMARNKTIRFGLGFLVAAYLPFSNLIPLTNVACDRYMYLPLVGFSIIAAELLRLFVKKNGIAGMGAAVLVLSLFASGTVSYGKNFRKMYPLYLNAARVSPENPKARYNLGLAYMGNGDYRAALKEFNAAETLSPLFNKSDIWLSMAECHGKLGETGKAKEYYVRLIRTYPRKEAYNGLADIFWKEKKTAQVVALLEESVKILPDPFSYNNLGACHAKYGNFGKAAVYFEKAVNLKPDYVEAWCSLINSHERLGDNKKVQQETDRMATLFLANGWSLPEVPADER
ncbi:MAG: tetratricopeptide repeat protein [Endomicrobiales bacterium]|nr:tetratricopeptide repeat protein [Endomicrobiales bacterium]